MCEEALFKLVVVELLLEAVVVKIMALVVEIVLMVVDSGDGGGV